MIKRLMIVIVLTIASLGVVSYSRQASAVVPISDVTIQQVKLRCIENQAAINRLKQTDAFLRIDRGSLYQDISGKLMTPLNERIAEAQLDGNRLAGITADFSRQYDVFYSNYISYNLELEDLLQIDCKREPRDFYNLLVSVREKRQALDVSNKKLVSLVVDYRSAFKDFRTEFDASQVGK